MFFIHSRLATYTKQTWFPSNYLTNIKIKIIIMFPLYSVQNSDQVVPIYERQMNRFEFY